MSKKTYIQDFGTSSYPFAFLTHTAVPYNVVLGMGIAVALPDPAMKIAVRATRISVSASGVILQLTIKNNGAIWKSIIINAGFSAYGKAELHDYNSAVVAWMRTGIDPKMSGVFNADYAVNPKCVTVLPFEDTVECAVMRAQDSKYVQLDISESVNINFSGFFNSPVIDNDGSVLLSVSVPDEAVLDSYHTSESYPIVTHINNISVTSKIPRDFTLALESLSDSIVLGDTKYTDSTIWVEVNGDKNFANCYPATEDKA
jgi:hypothetical protein